MRKGDKAIGKSHGNGRKKLEWKLVIRGEKARKKENMEREMCYQKEPLFCPNEFRKLEVFTKINIQMHYFWPTYITNNKNM